MSGTMTGVERQVPITKALVEDHGTGAPKRGSLWRKIMHGLFGRQPALRAAKPVGRAKANAHLRASEWRAMRSFAVLFTLGRYGNKPPKRRAVEAVSEHNRAGSNEVPELQTSAPKSTPVGNSTELPHKDPATQPTGVVGGSSEAAKTNRSNPLLREIGRSQAPTRSPKAARTDEAPLQNEVKPRPAQPSRSRAAFAAPPLSLGMATLSADDVAGELCEYEDKVRAVNEDVVGKDTGTASQVGLLDGTLQTLAMVDRKRHGQFAQRVQFFKSKLLEAQRRMQEIAEAVVDGNIDSARCIGFEQELRELARSIEDQARSIDNDDRAAARRAGEAVDSLRAAAVVLSRLDVRNVPDPMQSAQDTESTRNAVGWQDVSNLAAETRRQLLSIKGGQPEHLSARHPETISFKKHKLDTKPVINEVVKTVTSLAGAMNALSSLERFSSKQANGTHDLFDFNNYELLMRTNRDRWFRFSSDDSEESGQSGVPVGYDENTHYDLILEEIQKNAKRLDDQIALLHHKGREDVVSLYELDDYSKQLNGLSKTLRRDGQL